MQTYAQRAKVSTPAAHPRVRIVDVQLLSDNWFMLKKTTFEYLRNDKFDSRGYFDSERLGLHQNQFGGTILGTDL